MQSINDVHVLSRLAMDREAQLRRSTTHAAAHVSARISRQWLGRQLVRLGAWLAADPTLRRIGAR